MISKFLRSESKSYTSGLRQESIRSSTNWNFFCKEIISPNYIHLAIHAEYTFIKTIVTDSMLALLQ